MSAPRLLAAAATAALITATAAPMAQARPSLWDLFTPERILTRVVQTAIAALRSQMDITYGGIAVAPLTGTVTLTELRLWPAPPWDQDGSCQVDIARLTIRTAAVDEPDLMRLRLQGSGVTATPACLPPEARGGLGMLGIDTVSVNRATMDVDYTLSSASADLRAYLAADRLAAVSLGAQLDYLAMDARTDPDKPMPVAYLSEARLTVENLGLWDKVKPLIPPPLTDPASGGATLRSMVAAQMPPQMAGTADGFLDSLASTWQAFLTKPEVLVVETGFDASAPMFLDPDAFQQGPEAVFGLLQPVVASRAAPVRALLPVALLGKAPEALSEDEKLQLGVALASGLGAPRDLAGAEALLAPLAEAGNAAAAGALAAAFEARDPARAYGLALTAAAAGDTGAGSLLDRLEGTLPFADVLAAQSKLTEGAEQPVAALADLAAVRAEATARLTGRGRTRSYADAAVFAMIGAAAGDAESADILQEIDEKVRMGGPEAAEAWAPQEEAAVALAKSAWIGFDLPGRFGGE